MNKEILVVDKLGNSLAPTYLKRARQLVKSGRAAWSDYNTICIFDEEKERNPMEDNNTNGPRAYEVAEPYEDTSTLSDEALYKRAQKIVRARRAFINHLVAYVIINLMLMIMSFADGEMWFLFVALPWGIGLISHFLDYKYKCDPSAVEKEFQKQKEYMRRSKM
ncbi:2TM domain-containing protein [Anaeropeptidivorans aminofermentans]|jgi:hypothetical protein|uniref:2TM domain-containing protein n=1 Tax=Anaeropeptidivorans aminofermentans TaxID=2934315 RepID=UPI0020243266|nr:2TM domain-containing protein [Anaeropeptidivorans aminofermentans]MBE6011987.1 hypothetical protein [Lachnospiraceae bacterium]